MIIKVKTDGIEEPVEITVERLPENASELNGVYKESTIQEHAHANLRQAYMNVARPILRDMVKLGKIDLEKVSKAVNEYNPDVPKVRSAMSIDERAEIAARKLADSFATKMKRSDLAFDNLDAKGQKALIADAKAELQAKAEKAAAKAQENKASE